jgi:hypothetical protein
MAICGVLGGVVRRECLDPPHDIETPTELINWALERVTGERRSANNLITATDVHFLMGGEHRRSNGEIVKCVVPIRIVEAINLLIMRGIDR